MSIEITYEANKPLINSILTGLFYFIFWWVIVYSGAFPFIYLMLFLPGVTFPVTTCYFKNKDSDYKEVKIMLHFILSVGIYFSSAFLFTGSFKFITLFAGFIGSLSFLLSTKFILKKEITIIHILITAVLSGLAFLPCELFKHDRFMLTGFAVFLWTVTNGVLLNREYRKNINV